MKLLSDIVGKSLGEESPVSIVILYCGEIRTYLNSNLWILLIQSLLCIFLFQECEASLKHKTELISKLESQKETMASAISQLDNK